MKTEGKCVSSKNRYKNEKDAQLAARDGMLFRDAPQLKAYFCLLCLGYHLSSNIREKKVKRKSR